MFKYCPCIQICTDVKQNVQYLHQYQSHCSGSEPPPYTSTSHNSCMYFYSFHHSNHICKYIYMYNTQSLTNDMEGEVVVGLKYMVLFWGSAVFRPIILLDWLLVFVSCSVRVMWILGTGIMIFGRSLCSQ
mgnify:CR=1 FL=1